MFIICSASPPRRRELDNVMKKARKEGPDKSDYWNKKLIEVEEKDPNRCEQYYIQASLVASFIVLLTAKSFS